MAYKKFTKKEIKKGYPYTLKEFDAPVLKNNGKPYKWGSIIPLLGGEPMGISMATKNKPQFILSYSAFAGNDDYLRHYWPEIPYHNLDEFLEGENARNLDEIRPLFDEIDLVCAVCPCAGLSSMNASVNRSDRSRGSDAVQNKWMYDSAKFVLENIKPKVFWGENAPTLFTNVGQGVADNLAKIAEDYGYSFSLMKTNTLLHGIPQRRERTFYFFWQSKTAPYMNFYNTTSNGLIDYLSKIPEGLEHSDELASGELDERFPSYEFLLKKYNLTHPEFVKKNPQHTLHGFLNCNGLIEEAKEYITTNFGPEHHELKILNHIQRKLDDDKGWWDASPHFFYTHYSAVVARNMWCGMHPVEKRYMTIRELLWLMGLPFDFNFKRNEKGHYNTNAMAQNVPVATSRDMTLEIMKFINGELSFSDKKYLRQNNTKPEIIKTAKAIF